MIGTPLYMSPEQFNSNKYGFKSDIWAFGCCVYEFCNFKHAFEGSVMFISLIIYYDKVYILFNILIEVYINILHI